MRETCSGWYKVSLLVANASLQRHRYSGTVLSLKLTAESGLRCSLQVPCSGPCSGKEGIQGVDEQNYRIMPSFTVNLPYLEKTLKTDENLCRKTNRPSRAAISPPDL